MAVLLGAGDALTCPVRIGHDHGPSAQRRAAEPDPGAEAAFEAATAFRESVYAALLEASDAYRVEASGAARRIAATMAQVDAGRGVILDGRLPDDVAGGRQGGPQVLVRVGGAEDAPRYLPGIVRHHSSLAGAAGKSVTVSTLAAPAVPRRLEGWAPYAGHRLGEQLRLAHHLRMLQAAGLAGADAVGLVIGTTRPADDLLAVWHELDAPTFRTYSRSAGSHTALRSGLERHDHEFGFRVRVARGAAGEGEPIPVDPIGQEECGTCPYWPVCDAAMAPDDASRFLTKGRLDVREWRALHGRGVLTLAELADLDTTDPGFREYYEPEAKHRAASVKRVAEASARARLTLDGVDLRRTGTGPLTVPTADVEVDLDVEWDEAQVVYLWGARVRQGQDENSAVFHPEFTVFEPLDAAGARALALRFAAWLRDLIARTVAEGRSIKVFHWTHPERTKLVAALGADGAADLLAHFVDVNAFVAAEFFDRDGLGIKQVAPLLGFRWRVDDPGGLISQQYLAAARAGDEGARAWLRSYNEDDCAAPAWVRDALRAAPLRRDWPTPTAPGSET